MIRYICKRLKIPNQFHYLFNNNFYKIGFGTYETI